MTKRQLVAFESRIASLWEKGKIHVPVHFSGGNEDELIRIFKVIDKKDYVFSTHRNHYHFLLHTGHQEAALLAELLGRCDKGICGGKSGSMHTSSYQHRFYSSGIVAGCVGIATGVALALKKKGSTSSVWCFVGDGGVDEGWFWEALRYAHGQDLPIVFIVEDNNRSVCTSKRIRWGEHDNILFALHPYRDKVVWYKYKPTYPHVGTGKDIEW